jgi:uncharacterized membrane protein YbhN (UPF0104 family)
MLSLGLTLIFAWLLFQAVDLASVIGVLRRSRFEYIGLAMACYAFTYLLRALRIQRIYVAAHLSLWPLWQVMALHNLLNYLLPLRTGDVSLIYLLWKRMGVSVGASAGIWALVRLLDILVALIFLSLAMAVYVAGGGWAGRLEILVVTAVLSVAALIITLMLPQIWRIVERLIHWLQARIALLRKPGAVRLIAKLDDVGSIFAASGSRWVFVELMLTSAGIWLALFGCLWGIIQASGLELRNPAEAVIASSGAVIANFLPINSVASLGTFEAGLVAGFVLIGVPPEISVAPSVAVHVWILLFAAEMAAISLLARVFRRSTPPAAPEAAEETPPL